MIALTAEQLIIAIKQLEPTLNAEVVRQTVCDLKLHAFKSLLNARVDDWTFFSDKKLLSQLFQSKAGGLVISLEHFENYQEHINNPCVIVCDYPYVFFALAMQVFEQIQCEDNEWGYKNFLTLISSTAQIAKTAQIGFNVKIADYVVIEDDVIIEDNSVIDAHCVIGQSVKIGQGTHLYPHVTAYKQVMIGQFCIIHSGTVIGSDGFGFAPYQKRWLKIPQTGSVIIHNQVEIGANCTIDRGALGDTVIGRGTKLDNLIQIAHNVIIGEDCAFASGVGIAGSAVLGNRIQVGGKAGILGHLSICDDVVISSFSLVTKTINKPGFYTGVYPLQENSEWEKNAVLLKKLFNLRHLFKK